MKRFSAIVFVVLIAVVITAGCSSQKKEEEEEKLKAVISNNLAALQEENLEKYMATLHPESPGYAKMELICPQIFQVYDLAHNLVDVKVIDVSGKEARVRTVQEARRLSGPENYRDNRSTMVHTLKKDQGEWKLYNTEQESMELID